jgi:hypothetical protein
LSIETGVVTLENFVLCGHVPNVESSVFHQVPDLTLVCETATDLNQQLAILNTNKVHFQVAFGTRLLSLCRPNLTYAQAPATRIAALLITELSP